MRQRELCSPIFEAVPGNPGSRFFTGHAGSAVEGNEEAGYPKYPDRLFQVGGFFTALRDGFRAGRELSVPGMLHAGGPEENRPLWT